MNEIRYRVFANHLSFDCNAQPRLRNGSTIVFWGGGMVLLGAQLSIIGSSSTFTTWNIRDTLDSNPCHLRFKRILVKQYCFSAGPNTS